MSDLVERLGYDPSERLLIVNCDDFGLSHAANEATLRALRDGVATSATLMIPCPWARDAAHRQNGLDVGADLTLTAEHERYRWGPLTHAPSLLDGDGGFPRTVEDLWEHGDVEEVRRECRAQLERASLWGVDVTHLDNHMGALLLNAAFFDVYLELAVDYGLPLRLAGGGAERLAGFPYRRLAAEEGVVFPDDLVHVSGSGIGSRGAVERALADLGPGVTEVYVHPSIDSPEARALSTDWRSRVDDLDLVTGDGLRAAVERSGARLISYRALRDLQRAA